MEAFFLPTAGGRRFCAFHPAAAGASRRRALLYVHPFAEEMNKSRRMAAMQARAFAKAGFDVMQIDLHGCGDSAGDHSDATWASWHGDLDAAWQWLGQRSEGETWLWGLRTGALLAANWAASRNRAAPLLLWQPVESGHRFVQQFLRLRVAGEAIGGDGRRSTTAALLGALAAGDTIEVAGYRLSPDLMVPIDAAVLAPPRGSRVRWVEISAATDAGVSRGASEAIAKWRADGVDATVDVVAGPPFWQTQDIVECPSLIQCSLARIER